MRADAGRYIQNYADAVDLHPVLYVSDELHVYQLLYIRLFTGGDGLCRVRIPEAGGVLRNSGRLSERPNESQTAGYLFFTHGLCEKTGV